MPASDVLSKTVKVFLADDSVLIRDRIAEMLASSAVMIVGEAGTPQGCTDAVLAMQPDVVVLDVQLDGGAGLDVLKAVRAESPHIAFVVFSNNSGPAYRKRYLAAGAASFLDKSSEFGQLRQAVIHASQPAQ